jgi:hypothetical protein
MSQLLWGFDAFCDDIHPQVVSQEDNCPGNFCVSLIKAQSADKQPINLQGIDRKSVQIT